MATAPATPAIVIGKDTVVGDISVAVFAKLGAADLAKLSAPQTAEISAEQAATFTPVTLAAVKQASLSGDALAAIPVKSITALVLKNVTPDNFNSLTVEQVAGLSADQVKTISDKTYAAMSEENLATFTAKGTLNVIDFKKVPADVIPKFLPSQIAGLSDAQLASLVQKSVEALTPEQTAALTATQAKAFTPNFVKFLSQEGVSGLTPAAISAIAPKSLAALAANIEALNDVNTPALTSAQVNALSDVQIKALSATNDDFQYLSKAALAGLVKKNIVGLDLSKVTDDQFVALTADQLNSLTQDDKGQVVSLSEAQVELITATQAKGLSDKFIGAMKDGVVSHLSDAAIGALTPKAFSGLADNIAGLTPANIAAMSSAQINSLNATKIAALSAVENAISSLSNAALAGLDKKNLDGLNVTKLSPEQIAALSADQLNLFSKTSVASLDAVANQIDSLSGEQVAAITVKQAAGLSPKFVEALAVGDVASLTDVAVAAIAPKAFASMAVEGLVEANLGLVTSAQINALDENDIYRLSDNNGNDADGANDLPFLSIAALAGLDKKNIKYVPMNTLTVEQFTSLKADQLNAFAAVKDSVWVGDNNAAELTATQAKGLLPIFTNKLVGGDILKMSDVAVAALAPKAFASLAVKELVESNLGLVTSAQINALTPAQIKLLGDNNGSDADGANDLQFLTKAALVGLDKKNITELNLTKLTPEQFAGLTADQLNLVATATNVDRVMDGQVQTEGATLDQLALLTVNQAKGLTPAFVEALTLEQVGKLTPEAIAALAPKSFVKIDFAGLSADNAGLITSAQINALSAEDITALSYDANTIKFIAPAALAGLDKKNIAGLTKLTKGEGNAAVQLLTAEQFAALKPAQIQLLPEKAIAELTSEDGIAVLTAPIIASFSPDQIAQIPAGSFGKIAPAAIVGLNAKNIVKVTDAQLKALTPDQAAFLTPDALKAFKTTMVDTAVGSGTGDLGSASFAGVTPAALKALAPNVLAAMLPATFAGITAEQVAALSPAQVKALTNGQIAKFDAEDAAALTPAQVSQWTAAQATELTTTAIANLTPDAVAKLNIASFDGESKAAEGQTPATSADIAVLTNEQFLKLTATQVATISAGNAAFILPAQVDSVKTLGSLKNDAIAALTNDVVEVLDSAHFSKLTTTAAGQLESFTNTQLTAFSDDAKAFLVSKGFSTISTSLKDDSNKDLATTPLATAKAAQAIETSLIVDVAKSGSATTIVVGKTAATVTGSDYKDNITGGAGGDKIDGGAGADVINGGAGADNITGGADADTLTGDVGADTFVFAAVKAGNDATVVTDTITDFTTKSDKLSLGAAGVTFVPAIKENAEVTKVTFEDLVATKTVIINGITITAPTGGLLAEDVASIYAGEADVIEGTNTEGYTAGAVSGKKVTFTSVAVGEKSTLTADGTAKADVTITVDTDGKAAADAAAASKESFTVTFSTGADAGDKIVFDGKTYTVESGGALDGKATASAFLTAYGTGTKWDATSGGDGKVTFTAKTAGLIDDVKNSDFAITNTTTDTTETVSVGTITQGKEAVIASAGEKEIATVTFADLADGKTVILNGVTVTAPKGGLSAEAVATLFASRASGAATVNILTGEDTIDQTGALSGAVVTLTAGAKAIQNDFTDSGTNTTKATIEVSSQGATTASATGNYYENLEAFTGNDALKDLLADAVKTESTYYFGVIGSDGYLVIDADTTAAAKGMTDVIKLSGVTDIIVTDIIA